MVTSTDPTHSLDSPAFMQRCAAALHNTQRHTVGNSAAGCITGSAVLTLHAHQPRTCCKHTAQAGFSMLQLSKQQWVAWGHCRTNCRSGLGPFGGHTQTMTCTIDAPTAPQSSRGVLSSLLASNWPQRCQPSVCFCACSAAGVPAWQVRSGCVLSRCPTSWAVTQQCCSWPVMHGEQQPGVGPATVVAAVHAL